MENKIDLSIADKLQELKDTKTELDAQLKGVNAELEIIENLLVDNMITAELDSFKRNGHTYSLKNELYASAKADTKQDLFIALKNNGAGDLVQEQVNANTLKSYVKELKAGNNEEIPTWIVDYLNVYEKTKISVRKA